jgi:exodeoxyribonuclease VII small subunit
MSVTAAPNLDNMNFETALAELEQITARLESQEVGLDEMAELVARSAELLNYCQSKLRKTQADVSAIIDSMKG